MFAGIVPRNGYPIEQRCVGPGFEMDVRSRLPKRRMLGVDHQPLTALVSTRAVRIDDPKLEVVCAGPRVRDRRNIAVDLKVANCLRFHALRPPARRSRSNDPTRRV
jgi:hypothetical protein